jgi:hypothetical protein
MPRHGLLFATHSNPGLQAGPLSLHGAACYHAARLDRVSKQGNWG